MTFAICISTSYHLPFPVRVRRGEDGCALGLSGLYPAGEGAGYAREQGDYARPGTYGDAAGSQYGAYDRYDQDAYGSTYKQGY